MSQSSSNGLRSPSEVSDVTADEFRRRIEAAYEPLVIRQFARDWPVVNAARQSAQEAAGYLKEFDDGRLLPLVVAPFETGGRLYYNDAHDGFNFTREQSTLSAGLDRMLDRSDKNRDPFVFFQCVPVARALPALENVLSNPLITGNSRPHIWIGSRITVAAHFDEAKNIAIVAAGKRRFTLFPPEQVKNLYVGRLDLTPAGQPISLADPKAPDFARFPLFSEALDNAWSVELSAGDAIYIPTPWWHHVESLEPVNVLVNYWWDGAPAASALPFTSLIHAIQAFRHLPAAERDAWKALVDHYAFETDGDPAEHLAPHEPGILAPMTPQLAQHIHQWLASQIGPPKK